MKNNKSKYEMYNKLSKIFEDECFEVGAEELEDFKYDWEVDDFFLMYAETVIYFSVYHKGSNILEMYLIYENGTPTYYISHASFYKYPGRKFGTRIVKAVDESEITNRLQISDRSDSIACEGSGSVWDHIVAKFPKIDYYSL